jgi:hypothetical protein
MSRGLKRSSFYKYGTQQGKCEVIFGKPIKWNKRKKIVEKIKQQEQSKNPRVKGEPIIFYGMNNV